MISIKKIINHGFSYIFISSVLNKIINFLCNSIIVHLLSKADYGTYVYAYNIIAFALLIAGLGIPSGLLQILSEEFKNKDKVKSLYQSGSSIAGIFNILLCTVLIGTSWCIPLKMEEARRYLFLLSLIPFFDTCLSLQLVYLRSLLRVKQYAIANNINTILLTIFTVIGAYWGQVDGVIYGKYLSYIVSVILFICIFKIPFFFGKANFKKSLTKELLKLSTISMANNGLSELLYLLDVFIMGITIANQEIIASYKVATYIPSALSFIPLTVITYIYPYFAQHRGDCVWLKKKYPKILLSMGGLNMVIILPLFILAPSIIRVFYGSNYQDAIFIFRILLINFFVSGTFRILSGNLLVTQRQLKFNFYVALFSGVVNTIGNFILIPKWGSMGAVLTTVFVVIITSILSTYKLCKVIYGEHLVC